MKIYNISQANYQTQTNKSKQPTFSARMKLDREVQLIHDLEKLDLDYGIRGFFRGKPFKTLMNKFAEIFPDQTVEFTYQKPVFYGFNYVKGNGFAQSDAKIYAKNIDTNRLSSTSLDGFSEHPFYEFVESLVNDTYFWEKQ